MADFVRCAHQAHFVAACARVDPEFLFEDAQRPVSLTVENGRRVVVVEDESLTGGRVVPAQGIPFARQSLGEPEDPCRARPDQRSGASSTAPFARLA